MIGNLKHIPIVIGTNLEAYEKSLVVKIWKEDVGHFELPAQLMWYGMRTVPLLLSSIVCHKGYY